MAGTLVACRDLQPQAVALPAGSFKGWARAVKALCPSDHGVAANVLGRDQQSLFATTPWDSQHAATAAFPGSQGLNVW